MLCGGEGGFIEATAQAETQQVASKKDFRDHSLLIGLISWWFSYVPSRIIYISQKTVSKLFDYFSIDLLAKTLFLPWKRDEIDTTNMALDDKLRVALMNLISRLVGAVVRSGTIIFGLLSILFVILAAFISVLLFIFAPVIFIGLIIVGIIY